ncbi:MAG: type II toxin-antitoxin system RelE/ParE family toxin [Elusimicrobia bacterium]|nr:type II toxin-antitoxin system RelE/ParE family toxin [Elusimicrobiota bacterium]
MSYRLELESKALKEFDKLPKERRVLLGEVFDDLQINPRPPGAKKLAASDGYRVRCGDYRVLYTVDDPAKRVRVYRVGHRSDVYRRP